MADTTVPPGAGPAKLNRADRRTLLAMLATAGAIMALPTALECCGVL